MGGYVGQPLRMCQAHSLPLDGSGHGNKNRSLNHCAGIYAAIEQTDGEKKIDYLLGRDDVKLLAQNKTCTKQNRV